MRSLILLRRPGILVVSGMVTGADNSGVLITNYFGAQEKSLRLEVDPRALANLKLKKGSMIIASTKDDFRVEMLLDGAEIPDLITLSAYTVRYNGSFDFEARGDRKEQHVFAGSVLSANMGKKAGRPVCAATIGWRRQGKEEVRNIIFDPAVEYQKDTLKNKRMIFVTEGARGEGSGRYYTATRAYSG